MKQAALRNSYNRKQELQFTHTMYWEIHHWQEISRVLRPAVITARNHPSFRVRGELGRKSWEENELRNDTTRVFLYTTCRGKWIAGRDSWNTQEETASYVKYILGNDMYTKHDVLYVCARGIFAFWVQQNFVTIFVFKIILIGKVGPFVSTIW